MSFTVNMPLSNQKINATTTLIRNNFNELFNNLLNDHVSLNDATPALRLTHKQVTLNVGVVPTTLANQVAVYGKNVGGITELFLRRANNGSEIALSAGGLTPNLVVNGGYTFLAGGLVEVWGQLTLINGVPTTLPNPGTAIISAIYNIQLTARTVTNNILFGVQSIAGNQFTAFTREVGTVNTPNIIVWYRALVAV